MNDERSPPPHVPGVYIYRPTKKEEAKEGAPSASTGGLLVPQPQRQRAAIAPADYGMTFGYAQRGATVRGGTLCAQRGALRQGGYPPIPSILDSLKLTDPVQTTPPAPKKGAKQSPKQSAKGNRFHDEIEAIARDEGLNPKRIVADFKNLVSADFLCGPPPPHSRNPNIPERVWQRVCQHFNGRTQRPYETMELIKHSTLFKEKAMVFIASRFTEQCLSQRLIAENFPTAQRLYQYLNWTIRISKVAQAMAHFVGREGARLMVIDTELHDARGQSLYALCTPNDVQAPKSQKWQLAALRTASRLCALLEVDRQALPRGVRASCGQFEAHRARIAEPQGLRALKKQIAEKDLGRKPVRFSHLKCIQTGNGRKGKRNEPEEKLLLLTISSFHSKVRRALECPHTPLVPMVSIVSRKHGKRRAEDFSVDYLLPVKVDRNWVGVAFRGTEPVMALMDIYDISNKALLCDPSFNVEGMRWFQNWYNRLRIVPDDQFVDRRKLPEMPSVPEIHENFPLCTETPPLPLPVARVSSPESVLADYRSSDSRAAADAM